VPADLPALTRLTEDVVAAMHVAEEAQLARRRRRASWRNRFPIATILLALLVAGALALHAAPAQGGGTIAPDGGTVAKACATGAGAIVVTGLAVRRPGAGGGVLTVGGGALCR
jgi:hypothetical protein